MAIFNKLLMKKLRLDRGLTIYDLSGFLNVSAVTISRYESGDREPNLEMIGKLSNVLEIPLAQLILEEKEMDTNEKYQILLKKEVLKEFAASILADIIRLQMAEKIEDDANPISILGLNISNIQQNKILLAKDLNELSSIEGYLVGTKDYVQELIDSFSRGAVA